MDIGTCDAITHPSAIAQALEPILLDILRLEPGQAALTDESNLYELGLESLNVVELLTQIEIRFDIVIDVEDLSTDLFQSYGDLRAFVARKAAEASPCSP
jgi:acyl carrier protein